MIKSMYEITMDCIHYPLPCESWPENGKDCERPCPPIVQDLDNGILAFPFIRKCRISDSITPSKTNKLLRDGTPLFIDSPTGRGKTYWVFHCLYPLVHDRGGHLLFFSSRYALKQQTKYEAIEAACPSIKENWTPSYIEKMHVFGDIEIYSYQDCEHPGTWTELKKKLEQQEYYDAIIFDECHYFLADADFNCYTESVFNRLLRNAVKSNALRVYMTGTPYYIFGKIFNKEKGLFSQRMNSNAYLRMHPEELQASSFQMLLYHYPRDYNYLTPSFFNPGELADIIKASNEKWLIFIDNIEKGRTLQHKLSGKTSPLMYCWPQNVST